MLAGGTQCLPPLRDYWDSIVESCMTSVRSALAAKAGDCSPVDATNFDIKGD